MSKFPMELNVNMDTFSEVAVVLNCIRKDVFYKYGLVSNDRDDNISSESLKQACLKAITHDMHPLVDILHQLNTYTAEDDIEFRTDLWKISVGGNIVLQSEPKLHIKFIFVIDIDYDKMTEQEKDKVRGEIVEVLRKHPKGISIRSISDKLGMYTDSNIGKALRDLCETLVVEAYFNLSVEDVSISNMYAVSKQVTCTTLYKLINTK